MTRFLYACVSQGIFRYVDLKRGRSLLIIFSGLLSRPSGRCLTVSLGWPVSILGIEAVTVSEPLLPFGECRVEKDIFTVPVGTFLGIPGRITDARRLFDWTGVPHPTLFVHPFPIPVGGPVMSSDGCRMEENVPHR